MIKTWWIISLLLPITVLAQQEVALPQLIQNALDSSILLQSNRLVIQRASLRNTEGVAGNLPQLVLSGNGQYDLNNTRLQFFDGETRTANNASNLRAGSNLDLNYNVIEGGAKAARKKDLEIDMNRAQVQFELDRQDVILEVIQSFLDYQLAFRQKEIFLQDSAYWAQIVNLNQQVQSLGRLNKVDLLQIEAQLNMSLLNLRNADRDLESAHTILEEICFIDSADNVATDEGLISNYADLWVETETEDFPSVRLFAQELERAENNEDLFKSNQWPVLQLFAGFGYNWSRNAVGILLSNQNYGPYGGLRLNWNLYSGHQTRKNIEAAIVDQEVAKRQIDLEKRNIKYQLSNAERLMAKEEDIILQTDQQITLIKEQIDLIYQQYKAGSLTIIELLEFQRQLNNASLSQALAKYRYDIQFALKLYWSGRLAQL